MKIIMTKKIGFIGVGNMATAIISGMLGSDYILPTDLYIFDVDTSKYSYFIEKGVSVCADACSLVDKSDIVFFAVKPQNFEDVLNSIKPAVSSAKIFVSIAAGISTDYIRSIIGNNTRVVRVMPNTPLLLSKGASAICCTDNVEICDFEYIKGIFSLAGEVELIDESHMNEIISVNGSSPAYIYLFAKAMADYAEDCGISREAAVNLICATLEGSAAMIKHGDDDFDTLIKKVSSPGGTTLAALSSLDNDRFYDSVKRAMKACTDRAEEIGR